MKSFFTIAFICLCSLLHAQNLHLYGGDNRDYYLGCLTCSADDEKSVWNVKGDYGSPAKDQCIWNLNGSFGGRFSNFSPFNINSSSPPAVMDRQGHFYGYFTIDVNWEQRASFPLAQNIYQHWMDIVKDIPGWYEKLIVNNEKK